MDKLLYSPKLCQGDLVRLVSPASYPRAEDIESYKKTLESWGLRCDLGQFALDQHGYMAGTDANRLQDLNEAFRDPEVRAILTTRGGAGAYRIADNIDFAAVLSDPKPLIGFSDITSIQLALYKNCKLGSIHGCIVGNNAKASVKQLLTTNDSIKVYRDNNAVSAAVEIKGRARGRLIGGNLQMFANAIGVYMPSMEGAILFLEYHRAGLGTIDRFLTQLLKSNSLQGVVGVVLGSFEQCRGKIDRGWNIANVLNDRLSKLGVPVLGGINAGHDLTDDKGNHDQYALPLGSIANIDTYDGSLTIEPIVK